MAWLLPGIGHMSLGHRKRGGLDRDRDLYGATDRTTGIAGGMLGERSDSGLLGDRGTAGPDADRGTRRTTGSGTD